MENLSGLITIRPLPLALGISIALGSFSFSPSTVAAPAASTTQLHHYDLPADILQQTLERISQQSGVTIEPGNVDISNYRSPAIGGNLSVSQAVTAALVATPLHSSLTASGNLVIEAPAAAMTNVTDASAAVLPEIAITSESLSDDAFYYNPPNSNTVMRSDVALKETPHSVDVISSKLVRDRQATNIADALQNSAGVLQTVDSRGGPSYKIRGYAVQQTSTNGVPSGGISNAPIQGIERIEVLKGPDSIMSGSSSPGGTVNIVRKAPVTHDLRQLTLELADYGEFKQGIDLGGALNSDKSLSYRLNLSNMKSDKSEPDFDGSREVFVAPALRWEKDGTRFTLGSEYSNNRGPAPRNTVALNGSILPLSNPRMFRQDDHFSSESKVGYYDFSQEIVDDWSFNSKVNYERRVDRIRLWQTLNVSSAGRLAYGSPFSSDITTKTWGTQNDFRGKIKTGFITQNLLIGMDYQHILTDQDEGYFSGLSRPYPDVSVYDSSSYDTLPKIGNPNYRSNESRLQQRGVIFQDRIDLGDRVHVMFAGKKAKWISDSTAFRTNGSVFNTSGYTAEKWVPNYGLSVDLTPQITAYANVLRGFAGTSSTDSLTRQQIAPRTSKNKEVGLKFSLLDDNLTATAAYFETQEANVPVLAPNTTNVLGTQSRSSKGWDLNLSGEPVPGWNITTGFTRITFNEPGSTLDNSVFSGQPKNSFTGWTSYELQGGKLRGWGAGVGVDAFSSSEAGTVRDSFVVPGGASTDASIFYKAKQYSVTLGVKNIFDRELYFSSNTSSFIPMINGRNARLTLVYDF